METSKEQMTARIRDMETKFDSLTKALASLEGAVSEFNAAKEDLDILRDYMDSGMWLKDYEADEAGQVPSCIKRGVLSQDGLYDLLENADRVIALARETLNLPARRRASACRRPECGATRG